MKRPNESTSSPQLTSVVSRLLECGFAAFSEPSVTTNDLVIALGETPTGKSNDFGGSDSYPSHTSREYRTQDGSIVWVSGICDQPGDYTVTLDQAPGCILQWNGIAASDTPYSITLTYDRDALPGDLPAVIKGWFGPDAELARNIKADGHDSAQYRFSLRISRKIGFKSAQYTSQINGLISGGGDPSELLPQTLRGHVTLTLPRETQ